MRLVLISGLMFLHTTQVLSQVTDQVNISGNTITFNTDQSTLRSLFPGMSPIESEYSYIDVYEFSGEGGFGVFYFYDNKLATISFTAYNNEPYPVSEDIEKFIENHIPYDERSEVLDETVSAFVQYYDVESIFIKRVSMRMFTDYYIIPVEIINEIREIHPNYLISHFN